MNAKVKNMASGLPAEIKLHYSEPEAALIFLPNSRKLK